MSYAMMVTLSSFLFALSPLNELEKGKQCKLHNFHALCDMVIIYLRLLFQDVVS